MGALARWELAALLFAACAPAPAQSFQPVGEGEVEAPFPVTPPTPPADTAPAQLTPCPSGWEMVADASPPTCEPWAEGTSTTCAADEASFPGEPMCALIGSACTSDDWASDLPSGVTTLFVKAGAAQGGDGSRQAPFPTFDEAMPAATPGTVIALAKGMYLSSTDIRAGVTVWGACVAQTTLTAVTGATAAASTTSVGATVRNLRITGDRPGLGALGAMAQLTAQDVVVDGALGIGWACTNKGSCTGTHVVIKGTRLTSTGTLGDGIAVTTGGTLQATGLIVSGNRTYGIFVDGTGSHADVDGAAVIGTAVGQGGQAAGISVGDSASLHVQRSVVESNTGRGAELEAGTLELEDVVIRGTKPISASTTGLGAGVITSGTLTATRVWCRGNTAYGIGVYAGAATITDSVIDATIYSATIQSGIGLGLEGGSATVDRLALRNNSGTGVEVQGATSMLTATDLTVSGTLNPPNGEGWGLAVINGGQASLTQGLFQQNSGVAIEVGAQGAVLRARDVQLLASQPYTLSGDTAGGEGIVISNGATAELDRFVIAQNLSAGILMAGSTVTATDVVVRDTTFTSQAHRLGAGVIVTTGAQLSGARFGLDGNHFEGLFSTGNGSLISLTDVTVLHTLNAPCDPGACEGVQPVGALAFEGGGVALDHFLLASTVGFGAGEQSGALDLSNGDVWGNTIGVDVVDQSFDLNRINQNVRYLFNGQRLGAMTLPLPDVPGEH